MKQLFTLLFVLALLGLNATAQEYNCYESNRNKGIQQMQKRTKEGYEKAIKYFNSAKKCPDKPTNNDLDAKIKECRRNIGLFKPEPVPPVSKPDPPKLSHSKAYNECKNILDNASAKVKTAEDCDDIELAEYSLLAILGVDGIDDISEDEDDELNDLFEEISDALEQKKNILECEDISDEERIAEEERKKAEEEARAKKGFMEITNVSFGNTDAGDNIITDYGLTLYDTEIRYLTARITYSGLAAESKTIELKTKIYKSDGTLLRNNSQSPEGYTWAYSRTISPGLNKTIELGYGNKEESTYKSGVYRFELWYNENKLYGTTFEIKTKSNALSKGEWRTSMRKVLDYTTQNPSNGRYKGQTSSSGTREGLGVYLWDSGSYNWGGWVNGDRNGNSTFICSEGYTITNCFGCVYYVGGFRDGKLFGTGTCYDEYGNLIYYGDFSNNCPTEIYPTTGNYSSYKFECIEYDNGDKYIGETKDGKRHGQGIYLWKNGNAWYGSWEDGVRNGYGIELYYNGSMKYGKWRNDTYSTY